MVLPILQSCLHYTPLYSLFPMCPAQCWMGRMQDARCRMHSQMQDARSPSRGQGGQYSQGSPAHSEAPLRESRGRNHRPHLYVSLQRQAGSTSVSSGRVGRKGGLLGVGGATCPPTRRQNGKQEGPSEVQEISYGSVG